MSPAGGRWWRLKYDSPVTQKEKRLSLGVYPQVSLKVAPERSLELRKQLANVIDPGTQQRHEKLTRIQNSVDTFEAVTREWYAKFSPE